MTKEITLHFYGYTWEEYAFQVSCLKGIFVVFSGKLSGDGDIVLNDILYIGYHTGISEMYEKRIFDQLKPLVKDNERIFLSYSEVPEDVDFSIIESKIVQSVNPKLNRVLEPTANNIKIVCEGNRGLIPIEI